MTSVAPEFDFSAGSLCLDFVNEGGRLGSPAELLRWADQAGIVGAAQRDRLAREAERRPRLAQGAANRAVQLRERLGRIFCSLARGQAPRPDDLGELNRSLGSALSHLRVEPNGEGFDWSWSDNGNGFDRLLWPVTRSAGELLTSDDVGFVRQCASDGCEWLFVDRSRTRRRRWCDMKVCGNRAKARRHYRRKKRSS